MTTKFTNTLHVPGKDVSTGQDNWTDCYSVVKSDFFAAGLDFDCVQMQYRFKGSIALPIYLE